MKHVLLFFVVIFSSGCSMTEQTRSNHSVDYIMSPPYCSKQTLQYLDAYYQNYYEGFTEISIKMMQEYEDAINNGMTEAEQASGHITLIDVSSSAMNLRAFMNASLTNYREVCNL